jgi:hypothetical protein
MRRSWSTRIRRRRLKWMLVDSKADGLFGWMTAAADGQPEALVT